MNPPKTCCVHLEVWGHIELWLTAGLSGRKEVEGGAGDVCLWRRIAGADGPEAPLPSLVLVLDI